MRPQRILAAGGSYYRSRERANDGMDGIPAMVDKRNFVGHKIQDGQDDKGGDKPV